MIAEQQNAAYEDTYGPRPSASDVANAAGGGLPKGSRSGPASKSSLPPRRPPSPAGSRPGQRKGNLMDALAVFGGLTGG